MRIYNIVCSYRGRKRGGEMIRAEGDTLIEVAGKIVPFDC
jgi:hypothetical protein